MNQVEKALFPLKANELYYKQHPQLQKDYYAKLPFISKFNGEPVYSFGFNDVLKQKMKHDVFLANSLSGNFTLLLRQHSRYSIVPLHIGDYIEINYVITGSVTESVEGHDYRLTKGDIFLIDTHTIHTLCETTEKDVIINILIKNEYFTSYFLSQIPHHGELPAFIMECISTQNDQPNYLLIQHTKGIRKIIYEILAEQLNQQPGANAVMESLLLILFINLTREKEYYHKKNEEDLAQQIQRYIQSTFRTVTLEQAAHHFSFQKNYFSALVKEKTGKNFRNLVLNKQMDTALHYLKKTDWPITQIISEVGCSNPTYFYKKFEQRYHMTPVEYRIKNTTN
ncbi:AraC family transcriptional regulator [Lactiplantibacillus plantarum]|jgi:AraC-like DNA-binding protein|uniref:AraC family transcriptional regulator n=1 Tax=Lactiplantibacillus plantarum TaxID=1590 RepID=UPI00189EDC2A|nr:AraC family transcriptional regulator [Lactiplantibacillus plantarum]